MRPPAVLRVKVLDHGEKRANIWLPLFLLWPLALVLALVAVPLWCVFALLCWIFAKGTRWLIIPWRAAVLACSLPGLRIEVTSSPDTSVKVYLL